MKGQMLCALVRLCMPRRFAQAGKQAGILLSTGVKAGSTRDDVTYELLVKFLIPFLVRASSRRMFCETHASTIVE